MVVFGNAIQIKRMGCNCLDESGQPIEPSVDLFVKVTKGCNAHCLFCSNAETESPKIPFDVPKLFEIIGLLIASGISVNRVNITGGEPSVVPDLVENILLKMNEPDYSSLHMHLNTNGLLSQSQELMRHPRWNSISMSLHHYDSRRLSELYGCKIAESAFRFEGIDIQKVNTSCNLVRGYVDNAEEAHKMLDFNISLGIPRIGFVALMKVNDYCREHFVDLDEIHLESIPHVYFTISMDRGSDCKCSNYLYNKGLRVLEIYMRNYANPYYCESSLVYDGEYLRQGFHKNNIIY